MATQIDLTAIDLFQITDEGRIGRLCRYFDNHQFTRLQPGRPEDPESLTTPEP